MGSSASGRFFRVTDVWAAAKSEADSRRASPRSEDEGLIARAQAGDEAALGNLLDRYGRMVFNIGFRVLRDAGEAQDLVQDVFLQVYRKCHSFDPTKGSFRNWLTQIASHQAFDRREYLNLRRFYDDRNLGDFVGVIRAACDVEYLAELSQSRTVLRNAFNQLSDKQRATLELYFFEGYTLREIGERLNESLANTRHHYYRGLERLKASLRSPRGN